MPDPYIFDSRDPQCKTPFGAGASGSKVSLTLRPLRQEGYSRAILTARFEGLNNHTRQLQMSWSGLDGARDLFSGVLDTGEYVGLIWYSFDLERLDGRRCERLGPYQLTVYDAASRCPPGLARA